MDDIAVTKYLENVLTQFLEYENGDISVTKFLGTEDNEYVLSGAPYCSSVSYKDPCCHNASDISICGPVKNQAMNLATSNDVTVTKFLDQRSNDVTVTKFLNGDNGDISVTKFMEQKNVPSNSLT